jgi:hypothetical protein
MESGLSYITAFPHELDNFCLYPQKSMQLHPSGQYLVSAQLHDFNDEFEEELVYKGEDILRDSSMLRNLWNRIKVYLYNQMPKMYSFSILLHQSQV